MNTVIRLVATTLAPAALLVSCGSASGSGTQEPAPRPASAVTVDTHPRTCLFTADIVERWIAAASRLPTCVEVLRNTVPPVPHGR